MNRISKTAAACCGLLTAALTQGCASVTFDLTDIDEPVMLNPLPPSGAAWSTNQLGAFSTDVAHATGGASGPTSHTNRSGQIFENEAQLDVFTAIGGHANRAIAIDQIEAYGGGGNMLFVFVEASGVMVKGNVVELSGVNTSASSTSRGETK